MKIVHTTQTLIADMVRLEHAAMSANRRSRKILTVVAVKKGTNQTTVQAIKRTPDRVTATFKGAKSPNTPHLIRYHNPKADGGLGGYRSIVAANITSAIIDRVIYVATDSNPL